MKKVFLILIFVSFVLPVQTFAGEGAKGLDWAVKDFLSLPAISDDFAKDLKKQSDDSQRVEHVVATPKKKSPGRRKTAPEKSVSDLCQLNRMRAGEGGASAVDDGVIMTMCEVLPSDLLLSAWGKMDTGGLPRGAGTLSFSVQWQGASPDHRPTPSFTPLDCETGGISTVEAMVYGSSNRPLASGGPWTCSGQSGIITDIPAGPNVKLVVTGKNASGNALYRGELSGITIIAGRTTTVGTVTAEPFSPVPAAPGDGTTLTNGRVGFTWTGAPSASSFRIQLSKNPGFTSTIIDVSTTSASYITSAALSSHTYFWRVKAEDAFNNSSAWSPAWSITVDASPPFNTTAGEFINNGVISTNSATVSLTISAVKNNGIAAYFVSENPTRPAADASSWVNVATAMSYSSNVSYTLSSGDGTKTVSVWFKDAVGNVSKVVRDSIILDTTPPDTTIIGQPANPTNATAADFFFTATEIGSAFQCSLDSGAYTACGSPHSYTGLAAGPHTIDVRAIDAAGNIDPIPARYAWTIDTTPPDTAITAQPAYPTNSTTADFVFTSTETGSAFQCSLDSGAYTACSSLHSYASLTAGPHTIDVKAIDAAGNIDPIPASYTWTIDTTPPDTAITGQPANSTNSTADSFSFSSTEPGSTFQCQLDGSIYAACSSPHSYAGLAAGPHTFTVKATDVVGNIDPTPASYTWTIDTTPPDTTIMGQPADPTNLTTADFVFASTEAVSTFQCSLDGGAYTACSSPYSYTDLAAGPHTIDVKAIDAAGNIDPIPASYAWTIDTTPPDTTITIQPANPTNATSTNFSFSSTEAGSTFECQLDGGAYEVCSSPHSYADLAGGPHTFTVKATDAVGNIDPTPANYAWDIDTTPPDTAITDRPPNPSNISVARFSFTSSESGSSFECQLDGGAYEVCSSPHSYADLAGGPHTFTVKATDAVGNIDPTPESFTWATVLPPKNLTPAGFINKGGAYYIHSNVVKLSIAATGYDGKGVKAYFASESPVTPSASDPGWVTFPVTKEYFHEVDFTLSEGNGKKTVYVWFKDPAGNISEVKSDTIHFFNAEHLVAVFLILQLVAIF